MSTKTVGTFVFWAGILASVDTSSGAPSFACEASAPNKPLVRAEGLTEQVGDLLLRCHGKRPEQSVKVALFFNSQFTSAVVSGRTTQALLVVEKPGSPFRLSDLRLKQNAFQGELQAPNVILWDSLPLPEGNDQFDVQFRITNLRVNASGLGASATLTPTQAVMYAMVGSSDADALKLQETVAYVAPSMTTGLRRCDDSADIRILEFADTKAENEEVFGPRRTATLHANLRFSETQTFSDAFSPAHRGSTSATSLRLMAMFRNVGHNVRLYVTTKPNPAGTTPGVEADLVSTDESGGGTGQAIPAVATGSCGGRGLGLVPLKVENGHATAVWEVRKSAAAVREQISFGVAVAFAAAPSPNAPSLGSAVMTLGFAPAFQPNDFYTGKVPTPAYILPTIVSDFLRVIRKSTWVLFPEVTNIAGYDTGIAIENTSQLNGRCTIFYGGKLGNGAVSPTKREMTNSDVPPSGRFEMRLSVGGTLGLRGNPNFGGCMLAACDFPQLRAEQKMYNGPGPEHLTGSKPPIMFDSVAAALKPGTAGCDSAALQFAITGK